MNPIKTLFRRYVRKLTAWAWADILNTHIASNQATRQALYAAWRALDQEGARVSSLMDTQRGLHSELRVLRIAHSNERQALSNWLCEAAQGGRKALTQQAFICFTDRLRNGPTRPGDVSPFDRWQVPLLGCIPPHLK